MVRAGARCALWAILWIILILYTQLQSLKLVPLKEARSESQHTPLSDIELEWRIPVGCGYSGFFT